MAVAAALQDWGLDNGATCTAHWFQPLGSNEVRPGMAGMVINHFFTFNPTKGNIELKYDGETLVKGETDGSSYPNGGLRATHTAGGYTSASPCPGRAPPSSALAARAARDRAAGAAGAWWAVAAGAQHALGTRSDEAAAVPFPRVIVWQSSTRPRPSSCAATPSTSPASSWPGPATPSTRRPRSFALSRCWMPLMSCPSFHCLPMQPFPAFPAQLFPWVCFAVVVRVPLIAGCAHVREDSGLPPSAGRLPLVAFGHSPLRTGARA